MSEPEYAEAEAQAKMQGLALKPGTPAEFFNEFVQSFLEVEPHFYDSKTMLWWRWDKKEKKWEQTTEIEILRTFHIDYSIMEWIDPRVRNKLIEVLRVMAFMRPMPLPTSWIQFKNKVVDIETKEEFEPSRAWFFTNPLPFDIADTDETPVIDGLFEDWVGEKKQLLYEICAYCTYRAYPIPKIFVLFGRGRNGKSQFLKLLNKILGDNNIAATSIPVLESSVRFSTLKLMGKLMIQLTELRQDQKFPLPIFLQLTGGDLINFEVKRGGDGQFRNYGKVIMATNVMPRIGSDSDAVNARFFFIDFLKKFEETKKDIIESIPKDEYPKLMRKIINILPGLLETCKFSHEASPEDNRKRLKEKQNILDQFFEEQAEEESGAITKLNDLMAVLDEFCKARNVVTPSDKNVRNYIKYQYPTLKVRRTKEHMKECKNIWVVDGIHILTFSPILTLSHLIPYIGDYVKKAENIRESENINDNNSIISLFDEEKELTWASIQWKLQRSPEDTDSLINEHLRKGLIFEVKPGTYRRI
jgi:P4 family phage/plasmid primase-like protien